MGRVRPEHLREARPLVAFDEQARGGDHRRPAPRDTRAPGCEAPGQSGTPARARGPLCVGGIAVVAVGVAGYLLPLVSPQLYGNAGVTVALTADGRALYTVSQASSGFRAVWSPSLPTMVTRVYTATMKAETSVDAAPMGTDNPPTGRRRPAMAPDLQVRHPGTSVPDSVREAAARARRSRSRVDPLLCGGSGTRSHGYPTTSVAADRLASPEQVGDEVPAPSHERLIGVPDGMV
jgi:hypothetical protein